jgi:biopolymer transport protein ExbB/TolQ
MKIRRKIMAKKIKLTLIAAVAALGVALPTVAFAQSAYTTGTEASSVAAGYPSPYGS